MQTWKDARQTWRPTIRGRPRTVEVEHGHLTGAFALSVDGVRVETSAGRVVYDTDVAVTISGARCVVEVRIVGICYTYQLRVDGVLAPGGTSAEEHAANQAEARALGRAAISALAIVVGLAFVVWGGGWLVNGLRLPYFGWFVVAVGALGLLGVNVFRGGPLDRRLDAPR